MIVANANGLWCISGDSITGGNNDASVRLPRGIRDEVRPFYTRQGDGLARIPGAKSPRIATYDIGTPDFKCSGVAGDPIETLTAQYAVRVGNHNPNVLIVGLGANNLGDAIPGVLNPKVDALIAAITAPSSYQNGVVPQWLWWTVLARNDETPGGTNQAQLQAMAAVIGPKVKNAGGVYVDMQAYWLSQSPIPPPFTYTIDGVHLSAAGSKFCAKRIMQEILLSKDVA